ncbi:MAG: galactokinase family protein [Clostridia bacterium]
MHVWTPSRLCLFGEHLDYHRLEVVTMAIDLRFYATISKREDTIARIEIRDENRNDRSAVFCYNLAEELVYHSARDYFKSSFNVMKKHGVAFPHGFDIRMDSNIPIGKGMSSSSAMIVALIKAVLEMSDTDIRNDRDAIAQLAYEAEVLEFREPGGKMDHLASVHGGICHFDFSDMNHPSVKKLDIGLEGSFILFDSLEKKDTIRVLANAKEPVLRALERLGTRDIRWLATNPEAMGRMGKLPDEDRVPLMATLDNYAIVREFMEGTGNGTMSPERLGGLLWRHHGNLRDGLGISTPKIERILSVAMENGAYGGKINGSGGGGCCFAYVSASRGEAVRKAVEKMGFPAIPLKLSEGLTAREVQA